MQTVTARYAAPMAGSQPLGSLAVRQVVLSAASSGL